MDSTRFDPQIQRIAKGLSGGEGSQQGERIAFDIDEGR